MQLLNVTVEWLEFLFFIHDVSHLNLGPVISYLLTDCIGFSQSVQENAEIVL
jgi:hypothetical protein